MVVVVLGLDVTRPGDWFSAVVLLDEMVSRGKASMEVVFDVGMVLVGSFWFLLDMASVLSSGFRYVEWYLLYWLMFSIEDVGVLSLF